MPIHSVSTTSGAKTAISRGDRSRSRADRPWSAGRRSRACTAKRVGGAEDQRMAASSASQKFALTRRGSPGTRRRSPTCPGRPRGHREQHEHRRRSSASCWRRRRSRRSRACACGRRSRRRTRNSAPDTKPCEIICTSAPSMPCTLKMKKPSVTKPMCATDEYAISFFMSACTSATSDVDHRDQRQRDDQRREVGARRRGSIGSEKRRKP